LGNSPPKSNGTGYETNCDVTISPSTNTVLLNNRHNVTIKNCDIVGDCYQGIHLIHSSNNVIENNTLTNCTYAIEIYFSESDGNYIINNNISSNNHGLYIRYPPDNSIQNNFIENNYIGVILEDIENHTLIQNIICSSELHDIWVRGNYSGNIGVNNTCYHANNWNDNGIKGCTYDCSRSLLDSINEIPKLSNKFTKESSKFIRVGTSNLLIVAPFLLLIFFIIARRQSWKISSKSKFIVCLIIISYLGWLLYNPVTVRRIKDILIDEDLDDIKCFYECSNGNEVRCEEKFLCEVPNYKSPLNKKLKEAEERQREKVKKLKQELYKGGKVYVCPNTGSKKVEVSDRGLCADESNPVVDNVYPPEVSDAFLESQNYLDMYFDDERVESLDTDYDRFKETKIMYDKSNGKLERIYKLKENDESAIVLYFDDEGHLKRYKEAKRVLGYSRDDIYIFYDEDDGTWRRRCSKIGITPWGVPHILGKDTSSIQYFDFKRKKWGSAPVSVADNPGCGTVSIGWHKFGERSNTGISGYSIDDQNEILKEIVEGIRFEGNRYLRSLGSDVSIEEIEITEDYQIGRIKINKELTKGVQGDIILSQDSSGSWKVNKDVSIDKKEFMTVDGKLDKNKVSKRAILTGLSLYTGEKIGYGVRDVYLSGDGNTATVELSQSAVSGTNIGSTKITMVKKGEEWISVSPIEK